jgi:hypothetical protein
MITIEIIPNGASQGVSLRAHDSLDDVKAQVSMSGELTLNAGIKIALDALNVCKREQMYKSFYNQRS